jgi:hypothetical protein
VKTASPQLEVSLAAGSDRMSVPQVEAWAAKHGIVLPKPGWKAELAKRVKQQLLADGHTKVAPEVLDRWDKLFVARQEARAKADPSWCREPRGLSITGQRSARSPAAD